MSTFFSGQVQFINIHELDVLTKELARLLDITLVETTLPDLNYA